MEGWPTVIVVLCLLAYVLGTFPSAHIVARRQGLDITSSGSRNPGASNVGRLLGRRAGILVFVLDGAKGAIPALMGWALEGRGTGLAMGAAALVGHVVPVTRRGRGGKGVATAGGVCLALYTPVAVVALVVWLLVVKLARTASLASLAATLVVPLGVALTGRPVSELLGLGAMALVIVLRHSANLGRWRRGEEPVLASRRPSP